MSGASRRGFSALGAYLRAQEEAGQTQVTLTFASIETTLLQRSLPVRARSASRHQSWWYAEASEYHVWYGWRSVGWCVEAVDLAAETVTFARTGGPA